MRTIGGSAVRGFIVGTVITAVAFYVLISFLHQFVSYDGELIGLLAIVPAPLRFECA